MAVFVSKPLRCLPVGSHFEGRHVPGGRLCIEVGDDLCLCTLWPIYHIAGILECGDPPPVLVHAIVSGVGEVRFI